MITAELAQQLARARQEHSQLDPALLDHLQNEAEAYQLQALSIESYHSRQIGYKVGATNATSQKMLGCNSPFFGPVFEADFHNTGTSAYTGKAIIGGEAEFAFLIDRDIPQDAQLTQSKIRDYIRSTHVVVELIGRRTVGDGLPKLLAVIADFGGNTALIRGPAVDDWRSLDLARVKVVALTDGIETNSGTGAAVLGNPLNSLLWLHDTLRSQNQTLKAGQWVSTGTCLGVIPAKANTHVKISFEGCGEVDYRL